MAEAEERYPLETSPSPPTSKMNILLISTTVYKCPPDGYAGTEMVVYDLACALRQMGHEVTVVSPIGSRFPEGITHIPTIPPTWNGYSFSNRSQKSSLTRSSSSGLRSMRLKSKIQARSVPSGATISWRFLVVKTSLSTTAFSFLIRGSECIVRGMLSYTRQV